MSITLVPAHGRWTFAAASNLSGLHDGEYNFVALKTDGTIDVPGAGNLAIVLEDAPALGASYVAGTKYTCVFEGIIKVRSGAALNAGVQVTADTAGRAVAATSGQFINGVTVEACASGDYVPVRVSLSGATKA